MPPRLPSNLLDRSAQEAVRVLALSYLDQIDQARVRLRDTLDGEALHDFRVGVRRLRSAIRAYRAELKGGVSNKMRRQLRDLGRATNDGRDLEVQLAWLEKEAARIGPEESRGFYWMAGRLEARKEKTRDRAAAGVTRQYEKIGGKLRKTLSILRIELAADPGPRSLSFQQVTGALVRRQVLQVRDDLSRIRDPSDAEQIHQTRISLKRLRYLIEPIARRNRRAGALVRRLKEAQDLLGEHHDMHVLSSTVASLGAGASAFAGLEPGLATIRRLAEEAAAESFQRFRASWGGEAGSRILARADELGTALQNPAPPAPPQTLESTREPAVGDLVSQEIEQSIVTQIG
jgi:CHAD domain-containing protein